MEEKLFKFAKLLNLNMQEYDKAINEWELDNKKAIYDYLGFYDTYNEIKNFELFFYYYISENKKSYFHNYNTKGYTKGFKKLVEEYNINIDWDKFELQEEFYSEILVDVLMAAINYELKKVGKCIIGIFVGLKNITYLLLDIATVKELKKCNTNIIIFDTKYLEDIYDIIYEVTEEISPLSSYFSKGDYIMKMGEKYKTIFNDINKTNVIINYLSEEDKQKLKVIL